MGKYKLVKTILNTKLLYLNNKVFAWITPKQATGVLVVADRRHRFDTLLSTGIYCVYEVKNEDELINLRHLELQVGEGEWQGYLLPTGLPYVGKPQARIISTDQLISCNQKYRERLSVKHESRVVQ